MTKLLMFILVLGLAACSKSDENTVAEPEKAQKRFMEEKFQALDEAEGMQETLDEAAEKQRKAIEDAGG